MITPPLPENEQQRLNALRRYRILDTGAEEALDHLTRMAATLCEVPISLVSLVDEERQWFKSRVGLEAEETSREVSFCAHAIAKDNQELFTVPDALKDERFHDNPLVTGEPRIRFYAGQPIFSKDGLPLGTLCLIDRVPKTLTAAQQEHLQGLARVVEHTLESRMWARIQEETLMHQEQTVQDLRLFLRSISHDTRSAIGLVQLNIDLIQRTLNAVEEPAHVAKCEVAIGRIQGSLGAVLTQLQSGALLEEQTIRDRSICLKALVEQIFAEQHTLQDYNQVRLVAEIPEPLELFSREFEFRAILRNLISNAIKYTNCQTQVRVVATEDEQGVEVAVTDEGTGVDPEILPTLFQEAQVSREGNLGEKGMGVGLQIIGGLVQRLGGSITAENRSAGGACFRLRIPRKYLVPDPSTSTSTS